jgi:L-seryl-tRNA(Ser) seleniumtransferase
MKKNPLTRALRIDKMTVAALEATLRIYLEPDRAAKEVPTIEMLTRPLGLLKEQAKSLANMLTAGLADALEIKTEAGLSPVGGGSLPTVELPTAVVMIRPIKGNAQNLATALRIGNPAVLVYIREDWLILDPRTIIEGEAPLLVEAFQKASGGI